MANTPRTVIKVPVSSKPALAKPVITAAVPSVPPTPPPPPIQSVPAMTPNEPPAKHHIPWLVLILLLLIMVVGAGWYYYDQIYWSPQNALTRGFTRMADKTTARFSNNGSISASGTTDATVNYSIKGSYDSTDPARVLHDANTKGDVEVKFQGVKTSFSADLDTRSTRDKFFFKLNELPDIFGPVKNVKGKWYFVSLTDLKDKYDYDIEACKPTAEQSTKIKNLFKQPDIFSSMKREKSAKINDKSARHYTATIDIDKVVNLFQKIYDNVPHNKECGTTTAQDFDDLRKMLKESLRDISLEYWVKDDALKYQLSFVVVSSTSSDTVKVSNTALLDQFNRPVSIVEPVSADSIDKFLENLGLSSTLAPGTQTPTVPTPEVAPRGNQPGIRNQ